MSNEIVVRVIDGVTVRGPREVLDRDHLSLVLAAIAHAGGSHEHYPWPEEGNDG